MIAEPWQWFFRYASLLQKNFWFGMAWATTSACNGNFVALIGYFIAAQGIQYQIFSLHGIAYMLAGVNPVFWMPNIRVITGVIDSIRY